MPRAVLVTGASSGIGLATAIWLARRGFHVVGTVRSASKARIVERAAARERARVDTTVLDVTDAVRGAALIDELRPFGLVNNAGYPAAGAVEDLSDEDGRLALETMVVAPMRLARLALPHMRARGDGRIVNISSVFARLAPPFSGWYQAAKSAIEGLSDALRVEVASAGVRVVLIEPGGVQTGIWSVVERQAERLHGSAFDDAYRRYLAGLGWLQPFMAQPTHVAAAVGRAMTALYPRPRYVVGADAQLLGLIAWLVPSVVRDGVVRLALGL
jgi:NAD(P)-dependent dehydrogenase (short-subunit alcohol dehydrogenase family)